MMKIVLKNKYKPLISSKSRYFIITGGRSSGKSYSVASFLLMLTFEKGHKILFTRYTMSSAHISIIPEFIQKIEYLNISDYFDITKTSIINKLTGSEIIFKGIRTSSGIQTANLKSIEGITTWVLDEAEELVDENIFDKIDLSIRTKNNQNRVIIIMNPATKEHFIYKRFFEDMGIEPGSNMTTSKATYIHTSYLDNIENINESILTQIKDLEINNPKRYNHIIMGSWLDKADGVIFSNWSIGDFKMTDRVIYGSDFGFSIDPSTCIAVSFEGNTIYVKEIFHRQRMVTEDFINEYKKIEGNPLIIADSAESRLIEEINKQGINIRKTLKKPGSVKEGILFMQDYNIIVDRGSINIIKELNNYSWSDKASGQPIDKWNHCFVGDTLVSTDIGFKKIKHIVEGDNVLTSYGYRSVVKKWNNGMKRVYKYRMELDTFNIYVSCTPEHKIKTDKGWIQISQLQSGMMVYLDKHFLEMFTNYTQNKDILVEEKVECIGEFGNIIMEKDQKDIIYITKTTTPGIIDQRTLNSLKVVNTSVNTQSKEYLKTKNGLMNFIKKELKQQKNGINQKKVENGIENTELNVGKVENIRNISVNNVEKSLNQDTDILITSNTAIITARLKHLEQEESWSERVYDIMVKDNHEYFANGILVHNCVDAIRYVVQYNKQNSSNVPFYIG